MRIEPAEVVRLVEEYVDKAHRHAAEYDNSEPLDESGVWSLHEVAAAIYALGWEGGERAEAERGRRRSQRTPVATPPGSATL